MSFDCGQQRVMRLGWERPRSLAFRRVPTNRMREYFTYGSVGGAGGNPGSYPAASGGGPSRLQAARLVAAVARLGSFGGVHTTQLSGRVLGVVLSLWSLCTLWFQSPVLTTEDTEGTESRNVRSF